MSVIVHGRSRCGPNDRRERETGFEARLRRTLREIDREIRLAEVLAREAEESRTLSDDLRRAVREACLIRIFRLKSFFYGGPRRGEVVADDFFPDPERWTRERPPPGPHLERWLEDLALYVTGHFGSDEAARVPEEAWPLSGFVSTISRTYRFFLSILPPERSGWLDRHGSL